jgi:hypothetical protein
MNVRKVKACKSSIPVSTRSRLLCKAQCWRRAVSLANSCGRHFSCPRRQWTGIEGKPFQSFPTALVDSGVSVPGFHSLPRPCHSHARQRVDQRLAVVARCTASIDMQYRTESLHLRCQQWETFGGNSSEASRTQLPRAPQDEGTSLQCSSLVLQQFHTAQQYQEPPPPRKGFSSGV